MHSNESIRIEKGLNNDYKLIVEKTELLDSGNYRVILSNDFDSVESTCRVAIQEAAKAPIFRKELDDQSIPLVRNNNEQNYPLLFF